MMGSGMENARLSIAARVPLVDPINVLQANVLLRMRADENQPDIQTLRDAFAVTVQGVAAGACDSLSLIGLRCPLPALFLCFPARHLPSPRSALTLSETLPRLVCATFTA